jgi:hypothetical protein
MCSRLFIAILSIGLLNCSAIAKAVPAFPFVDGRWSGLIETMPNSSVFEACAASTTFTDGTTLTLAKQRDNSWLVRFSNPGWRLPSSHYPMVVVVDFYSPLAVSAVAKNQRLLEIAIPGHNALLKLIENGHLIKLTSDSFEEAYNLEGSAKVIERVRNCVADQLATEGQ